MRIVPVAQGPVRLRAAVGAAGVVVSTRRPGRRRSTIKGAPSTTEQHQRESQAAAGPHLGSFSSIASHGQWVTSWVGKANHNARSTAKLLMQKQKIPAYEQYDIVLM